MNAKRKLKKPDREEIAAAIAEAEKSTSAEIVCAVATESGRYDRAEAIAGLLFSVLALGGAHLGHDFFGGSPGDWDREPLGFGWQVLAVVAGFVLGHLVASFIHPLRRVFVSEKEIDAEVGRAAWQVFGAASIRGTTGASGLLIYASLFEHRVLILADQAAFEALGQERIDTLRDTAVESLKSGRIDAALRETVSAAGTFLAETLPATREHNPNELADHVLVFHPRPDLV